MEWRSSSNDFLSPPGFRAAIRRREAKSQEVEGNQTGVAGITGGEEEEGDWMARVATATREKKPSVFHFHGQK